MITFCLTDRCDRIMYAGQKNMQKCLVKSETLHTFVVGTDAISINKVHNSNAIWRCLLSTFSYADCVGSQNLTRQRLFLYTKLLTDKWEPKLKAQWPRITVTAVHNPHLQSAGKTSKNNPHTIGSTSTADYRKNSAISFAELENLRTFVVPNRRGYTTTKYILVSCSNLFGRSLVALLPRVVVTVWQNKRGCALSLHTYLKQIFDLQCQTVSKICNRRKVRPSQTYSLRNRQINPAIIGIPFTQTNSDGRYLPSNATYTAWKSRDHNPAPAITPVEMYISNVYTKNDTRISRSDVPSSTLWKAVAARALLTSESIVVLYTSNARASASNRATS